MIADPDRTTLGSRTQGVDASFDPRYGIGTTFGRYQEVEFLGSGGMGVVFKAQDPTLGRKVAIKVIRGTDESQAARLLLEAKAQARIEHENVCHVYDAGIQDGRPYIAMQFIEGHTIPDVQEQLSLEETLRLMKDVALGVHAAHRAGLVHRDLKPGNVMVERQEDGRWHPYVMDFGLAREVGAPGATVTGIVMGTPWYMSPEQAQGLQLDRRSDVYALGASLYDLLGGAPPFGCESSVTAVMKLLSEEPLPLRKRNGALPKDVETIVMKCLEKDPSRRYDSARALAEDIGRFLEGEPLAARPPSTAYRLLVRARKNRASVSISAVAFVLVTALAVAGLRTRAAARRQVALASEFSGIVKDVEWRMRVAHLAPLHDTLPEKTRVRKDLGRIEERMRTIGGPASGPGEYALGRGQLVLGDADGARKHLEGAWKNGYQGPEVAYALGLALGKIYERERTLADGIGNKILREAKQKEIEASLRDPAVQYLRQSGGTDVESPDYVQALLSFYEKRYDDALGKARAVREQAPWLYEAGLLEGDIRAHQSQGLHETGDEAASQKAVQDAEGAFKAASSYARSDPAGYEGLCQMELQRMEAAVYSRGNLEPLYNAGQEACGMALQADSERAEAYAKLSNMHRFWAESLSRSGGDPAPALKLAEEAGQRALTFDAENRRANGNLGVVYRLEAEYAEGHGQDGSQYLDRAFQSLQKAVEISGGDAPSVNDLGNAYSTRSTAVRDKGGDPRPDLTLAVQHYDQALARVPDFGYAHANKGIVLTDKARYEMDHGVDPEASFREAFKSLERCAELLPKLAGIHTTIADSRTLHARFEQEQGHDPQSDIAVAKKELDLAKEIRPTPDPDALTIAGRVFLVEAQRLLRTGVSPLAALSQARALFQDAENRDKQSSDAASGLGQVELLLAQASKDDPTETLRRASADFGEATRRNPKDADAFLGEARADLGVVTWKLAHKTSPDAELAAGLRSIDHALSIQPSLAPASALKGALLVRAAEAASDPQKRRASADLAEQALTQAVGINGFLSGECGKERERLHALR